MKKIISSLIVLVMCFSLINVGVNAKGEELVKVTDKNVESLITTETLNWAKQIEPDLNFIVGDIIQINSTTNDEVEYTASLFHDTMPYGYVVVGFVNHEAIVKESNISKGQEGLYTKIIDNILTNSNESRKNIKPEKSINKISALQYSLSYKDKNGNKLATDNYGHNYSDKDKQGGSYNSSRSIYIRKVDFTSNYYKVKSEITLKKFVTRPLLFSDMEIISITSKYACGVQALLQIGYMEGLVADNPVDKVTVYNILWNYTKTKEINSVGGVDFGSGNTADAANGFVKFAKEKGYKGTAYNGVQKNPSVAWIKDKLQYNRPILLRYGINVKGKWEGHFISVLGWVSAQKVDSGNTWNYLKVYNSWDETYCYLNYSTVDLTDCDASYFWVKK